MSGTVLPAVSPLFFRYLRPKAAPHLLWPTWMGCSAMCQGHTRAEGQYWNETRNGNSGTAARTVPLQRDGSVLGTAVLFAG